MSGAEAAENKITNENPQNSMNEEDNKLHRQELCNISFHSAIKSSRFKMVISIIAAAMSIAGLFFVAYSHYFTSLIFDKPITSQTATSDVLSKLYIDESIYKTAEFNWNSANDTCNKVKQKAETLLDKLNGNHSSEEMGRAWRSAFPILMPLKMQNGQQNINSVYFSQNINETGDERSYIFNMYFVDPNIDKNSTVINGGGTSIYIIYATSKLSAPPLDWANAMAMQPIDIQKSAVSALLEQFTNLSLRYDTASKDIENSIQRNSERISSNLESIRNTDITYISAIFNRVLSVFSLFFVGGMALRIFSSEVRFTNNLTTEYLRLTYLKMHNFDFKDFSALIKLLNGQAAFGSSEEKTSSFDSSFERVVNSTLKIMEKMPK